MSRLREKTANIKKKKTIKKKTTLRGFQRSIMKCSGRSEGKTVPPIMRERPVA